MQVLPPTFNTRKCSFGYGEKKGLIINSGKDSPPANTYKIRGMYDKLKPNQGFSFGMPHSVYAKTYVPSNKFSTTMKESPGPGAYNSKSSMGMHSRKFSLKSRVKEADSATRNNPPPNTYHPAFNQTENSKFQAITFGFGSRCNVTGSKDFSFL